jgi:Dullard-like phosphatase family protein
MHPISFLVLMGAIACLIYVATREKKEPMLKEPLLQQPRAKHNVLALDLDETLIHSKQVGDGFLVATRPHAALFLRACAAAFEVVVFTASVKPYADPILNDLDPDGTLIRRRYYRDSCVPSDDGRAFVKDLRVLGVDLASIALVDNAPISYSIQPENGIPIRTWMDDNADDDELRRLLPFLLNELAHATDVRVAISTRYSRAIQKT